MDVDAWFTYNDICYCYFFTEVQLSDITFPKEILSGELPLHMATLVAYELQKAYFWFRQFSNLTFLCIDKGIIPQEQYSLFSKSVCEQTNLIDAFEHDLNESEFFAGKHVVLFQIQTSDFRLFKYYAKRLKAINATPLLFISLLVRNSAPLGFVPWIRYNTNFLAPSPGYLYLYYRDQDSLLGVPVNSDLKFNSVEAVIEVTPSQVSTEDVFENDENEDQELMESARKSFPESQQFKDSLFPAFLEGNIPFRMSLLAACALQKNFEALKQYANLTFLCIDQTNCRLRKYRLFSKFVCEHTNLIDAFDRSTYDVEFFAGKHVILFQRNASDLEMFRLYANMLKERKAEPVLFMTFVIKDKPFLGIAPWFSYNDPSLEPTSESIDLLCSNLNDLLNKPIDKNLAFNSHEAVITVNPNQSSEEDNEVNIQEQKTSELNHDASCLDANDNSVRQDGVGNEVAEYEGEPNSSEPEEEIPELESFATNSIMYVGDNNIPHYNFFVYPPQKLFVNRESELVRSLIYSFKDGKDFSIPIRLLINKLKEMALALAKYKDLTLFCIPASSNNANLCRYKNFTELLCNYTGLHNGWDKVVVLKDKAPKHRGGKDLSLYLVDQSFFVGRNMIIFDDVVTKGDSMRRWAELFLRAGAQIVLTLSLGNTGYGGNHPYTGHGIDDISVNYSEFYDHIVNLTVPDPFNLNA